MDYNQESIRRHRESRGKMGIYSKMPLESIDDLSIAYTPGVAAVSLAIADDERESFALTNRANTVAVVSDGSAVLGIGNVGPQAAMAVMEGKAILFKGLADIDAIPICLDTQDDQEIIKTVRYLAPSLGGVNLEDISAPRCFDVEEALQDLGIPVFHDDQHGTAVVTLGALINALKVTGKRAEDISIVFSGAGAAGIATTKLLMAYGVKNVILVDSKGIIHQGRTDLTPIKTEMLEITNLDDRRGGLAEAMAGSDVFVGVSLAGLVSEDLVRSMAPDPIVFPIVGTGRSDFPNQINNCLAFPGIFRGALDARAPRITDRMKIAAGIALAGLVEEPTPERVIPWALDKAVVPEVAKATYNAWFEESGTAAPASYATRAAGSQN
jgi:malate dehydrogenase (oxaloacetate-decarboxylating)